jgi:hypothetical protein
MARVAGYPGTRLLRREARSTKSPAEGDGIGLDFRCSVRERVMIGSMPGEGIGRAREDAVDMVVLCAGSAGGDARHVQIRASISTRKADRSRASRGSAGPVREPGPIALLCQPSRARMPARPGICESVVWL